MLVKLLQLLNAHAPILVTVLGIMTLVKLLQQENALFPILVTPSLTLTVVNSRSFQGEREKFFIFPVPLIVNIPSESSVHVRFVPSPSPPQ